MQDSLFKNECNHSFIFEKLFLRSYQANCDFGKKPMKAG